MPTYEYRCPEGHAFELFQKMSDEPGALCPDCGRPAERLLSGGAGFLFRGEGFYITDYRSEGYRKAEEKEKAKAEGTGPASDSAPAKASAKEGSPSSKGASSASGGGSPSSTGGSGSTDGGKG